jgi:hypothetical protein
MSKLRNTIFILLMALSALGVLAGPACLAQTSTEEVPAPPAETPMSAIGRTVEIHGFGSWIYGNSDGNSYLAAEKGGSYGNAEFSLNLTANPMPNLRILAQLFSDMEGGVTDNGIDYAFAEWRFSDALRLRAGLVQQPFGLYTEIFDVGTLRPFLLLPQSLYGPVGTIAVSYEGLGLVGRTSGPHGWHLGYDLYAGGLEVGIQGSFDTITGQLPPGETLPENFNETLRDVVGGRLTAGPPGDRLEFGVSAYTAKEPGSRAIRHAAFGVSTQYQTDAFEARLEAVRLNQSGELRNNAYYVETSYRLTPHWQIAARYDRLDTDVEGIPVPSALLRHIEASLGINYWLGSNFVLKLSVHDVKGNRFARPDELEALLAVLASGQLDNHTRVVLFGAQFAF